MEDERRQDAVIYVDGLREKGSWSMQEEKNSCKTVIMVTMKERT